MRKITMTTPKNVKGEMDFFGSHVRSIFSSKSKMKLTVDVFHEGEKAILRTVANRVTGKEESTTIPYTEASFKDRARILAARDFSR